MQRFRRQAGLALFWLSWLLWGVIPVLPFVLADVTRVAIVSTALVVISESAFFISLLLLGRPFYLAFKAKVRRLWMKVSGRQVSLE